MVDPSRLYHLVKKRLLVDAGHILITTGARQLPSGWSRTDAVYRETLLPLLGAARGLCLAGYDPAWLKAFPPHLPRAQWLDCIAANARKSSRRYFLPSELLQDTRLQEFWIQPFVYVPRTDGLPGNSVLRPAVAVLEFPVESVPVAALAGNLTSLASVSNPWAGGRQQAAAKRWCSKRLIEPDTLLLPYTNLGELLFVGSPQVLGRAVDRLMTEGGVAKRYAEWEGARLQARLHCEEAEALSGCVERILNGLRG